MMGFYHTGICVLGIWLLRFLGKNSLICGNRVDLCKFIWLANKCLYKVERVFFLMEVNNGVGLFLEVDVGGLVVVYCLFLNS